MLDENLPTFYLNHNGHSEQPKHHWTIFLCQRGEDPAPAYTVRHLDPSSPTAKNRYAVALCDPYVPDVVFAEVLVTPEWTQPSLSAEAIRLNGGGPPPPEPVLPSQFTVQLYNPDQQVVVRYRHKTWSSPAAWEFEMPQTTFRLPSSSSLDRTLSDPAAADVTPKLKFGWRKDGKLSKDLACLLSGKTATAALETNHKAKSKEPDITISIFKSLHELTVYEPNLYRVEMEDFKGLEVVLLLGAVTIRDIYFTSMKEAFNLSSPASPTSHSPIENQPNPPSDRPSTQMGSKVKINGTANRAAETNGQLQDATARPLPLKPSPKPSRSSITGDLPPLDPRSQWEIDTETAHLRKQQELEKQLAAERAREEERRTRKLLEAEEKARRKKQAERQAEIDKETKRLQKLYGAEETKARAQVQQHQQPQQRRMSSSPPHSLPCPGRYYPHQPSPSTSSVKHGPYLQVPDGESRAQTHSTLQTVTSPRPQSMAFYNDSSQPNLSTPQLQHKVSNLFGLRKTSAEHQNKLMKKRSSMF